jgi:chromate transport protein ChrA
LLAVAFFVTAFVVGGLQRDQEIVFMAFIVGLLASLPSLVAILLFHAVYSHNKKDNEYRVLPYLLLVLSINCMYWVVWGLVERHYSSLNILLILCTTVAGLISLAIVHWQVKKREQQLIIQDPPM